MYFAPSVFYLFCFSFTRRWYAVICVFKVKFTDFVSILLSFHAALWVRHYFRQPEIKRGEFNVDKMVKTLQQLASLGNGVV